MLKQEFFSKENIKGLNSKLLNKNNLESISREEKKKIVNILITNMKKVYKNIDAERVNKSNLESIKNQFNDWPCANCSPDDWYLLFTICPATRK